MSADSKDGQPSIEQLASEGVSIRKCIASGSDYGSSGSAPKSGGAKPKGSLASMKMTGKGY